MTLIYNGSSANNTYKAPDIFPYTDIMEMRGNDGNDYLTGSFLNPNLIYGGAGSDTLFGGAGENTLYGDGGDDYLNAWITSSVCSLFGGSGNDYLVIGDGGGVLDGGSGADTLYGGDGGDTYVVDSASDWVIESYVPFYDNDPNPKDTVQSTASWTLGANLEVLQLEGSQNINGTGNSLNNTITGNSAFNTLSGLDGWDTVDGGSGNDSIAGGNGNDSLIGGDGNDSLNGGAGNDYLNGGAGRDRAIFDGSSAITVDLSKSVAQNTGLGSDVLTNIEDVTSGNGNDHLTGNSAANRLTGGKGNDVLAGGSGNDSLFGGDGKDTLTGGENSDSFYFSSALVSENVDRVKDFDTSADSIGLDDSIFTGLAIGALTSAAFASNTTGQAGDASDRIIYEKDTGNLYFDKDGNGASPHILVAVLQPNLPMSNSDFFIF